MTEKQKRLRVLAKKRIKAKRRKTAADEWLRKDADGVLRPWKEIKAKRKRTEINKKRRRVRKVHKAIMVYGNVVFVCKQEWHVGIESSFSPRDVSCKKCLQGIRAVRFKFNLLSL